jgi:hypothetical protein
MNTITKWFLPMVFASLISFVNAQTKEADTTATTKDKFVSSYKKEQIEKLEAQKKEVEEQEREFLKQDIERINKRLDAGEITPEEAEKLKKAAAELRASNIQDKQDIINKKIALMERAEKPYQAELPDDDDDQMILRIGGDDDTAESFIYIGPKEYDKPSRFGRRTRSDVVFGIGFNNALIDGESLSDSPYKIGGSGFVELGYAWTTRLFNNSNAVRVKYGFSFQWNKLDIRDNQYFVNNDGEIGLEPFPTNLKKAKYRMTNLVFPLHFEFGPSRKIDKGSYVRYSTRNQFKIGIGGYGGFNIQTMQKLKYTNENGNNVKDKFKGDYNPSDLIYGVSGYVALGGVAVYCKYDLNPIFRNQPVEQHNISLGIRFDMD